MLKRVLALTIVSLLIITATSAQPALAGSKSDEHARFSEKVRLGIQRLGVGKAAVVEVKLRDKSKLSGYVSEANEERFVVTNDATQSSVPVAYGDVVKVKGNNLSTGAKIGIGVGVALIILAIYLNCCTG